jgi:hypothetical protein
MYVSQGIVEQLYLAQGGQLYLSPLVRLPWWYHKKYVIQSSISCLCIYVSQGTVILTYLALGGQMY